MPAWTLILFTLLPIAEPVTDTVEVLEYQCFYDDKAELVFRQFIFIYDDGERLQVRAWRLEKGQKPYMHNGRYQLTWHDGHCLRRVIANELRETHGQEDFEMTQRAVLPKEARRELSSGTRQGRRK